MIDIGGQDSKVIRIDENGTVENFVMNDKCAAGTGRFLEMMERTMEITLEEMSSAFCSRNGRNLKYSVCSLKKCKIH